MLKLRCLLGVQVELSNGQLDTGICRTGKKGQVVLVYISHLKSKQGIVA